MQAQLLMMLVGYESIIYETVASGQYLTKWIQLEIAVLIESVDWNLFSESKGLELTVLFDS